MHIWHTQKLVQCPFKDNSKADWKHVSDIVCYWCFLKGTLKKTQISKEAKKSFFMPRFYEVTNGCTTNDDNIIFAPFVQLYPNINTSLPAIYPTQGTGRAQEVRLVAISNVSKIQRQEMEIDIIPSPWPMITMAKSWTLCFLSLSKTSTVPIILQFVVMLSNVLQGIDGSFFTNSNGSKIIFF